MLLPTWDTPWITATYSSRWKTHTLQFGMLQWTMIVMKMTTMVMLAMDDS